jgi:hypothetical protein
MAKGLSLGAIEKATGNDPVVSKRAKLSLGSLEKTSKKTGVDLTAGLMECGLIADDSWSLKGAYDDGSMQATFDRTVVWSACVDGTGKGEAGFFNDDFYGPWEISLGNTRGWVNAKNPGFGGTNLYSALLGGVRMAAGALKEPRILDLVASRPRGGRSQRSGGGLLSGLRRGGSAAQSDEPTYGLVEDGNLEYIRGLDELEPIQTDQFYHLTVMADGGSNRGPRPYRNAIEDLVVRMSYAASFVKFSYIGDDPSGEEFMQLLDDMAVARHQNDLPDQDDPMDDPRRKDVDPRPGIRYIDNVDKVEFPHGLADVKDDEFAAKQTQELDTYVPSAVRRGLLSEKHLVYVDAD